MIIKQRIRVKAECQTKPKLRTFLTFKNFETLSPHVVKPLSFVERKMISKLRLGILPIRIETARYLRPVVPEGLRICYCKSGDIENESHILFKCCMYNELRNDWMSKILVPNDFHNLPTGEKFNLVLNNPFNVRPTAKFLVSLMDLRCLQNKSY